MAYKGQPVPSKQVMIRRGKVSDGKSVDVTVPEKTTIEAQDFYILDGFFGMALESVKTEAGETQEIALQIEQAEYESSKIVVGDTFNVGDLVYFDKNKFTTKKAGRLVGRVTNGKDENNNIWFIMLPQQADVESADLG